LKFYTYVLFSERLGKFYIGSTQDIEMRIDCHNRGLVKFTSRGIPWRLVWSVSFETRPEAVQMEMKIKKRGAKRFLIDEKIIGG
jgi:putative endonuclease